MKQHSVLKIVLMLTILPLLLFGQSKPSFSELITQAEQYFSEYNKLSPYGDEYVALSAYSISEAEVIDLVMDRDIDEILSKSKDSIICNELLYFFQDKLLHCIDQIVHHPDFLTKEQYSAIEQIGIAFVKSDDHKLLNISFDEKTGGSYRSQISRIYYINEKNKVVDITDNEVFARDGYDAIYSLDTEEGRKYVLTGSVRACSYCFETFVQLLNSDFEEEFSYGTNNRDWNDGVWYDHEKKEITVDYHIDDLSSYCHCAGEINEDQFDYDRFGDHQYFINCKCTFVFNGKEFELVAESWRKIKEKERQE